MRPANVIAIKVEIGIDLANENDRIKPNNIDIAAFIFLLLYA